jgi:hypothetical protein
MHLMARCARFSTGAICNSLSDITPARRKMAERLNCIQNQITTRNRVLIRKKIAGFIMTLVMPDTPIPA